MVKLMYVDCITYSILLIHKYINISLYGNELLLQGFYDNSISVLSGRQSIYCKSRTLVGMYISV